MRRYAPQCLAISHLSIRLSLLGCVLCRTVGEVLLNELTSCWTECAPGQLAAGPELTAVQCMEATLQCIDLLLHQLPSLMPSGLTCLPQLWPFVNCLGGMQ